MQPFPKSLAMERPTGAGQKHVTSCVWDPTLLTKGGGEMTESVEVHPCREVTCQELANPGSHKPRGHSLGPSQIRVNNHFLPWLQVRSLNTALLRSDLALIPPTNWPLQHGPRNCILP